MDEQKNNTADIEGEWWNRVLDVRETARFLRVSESVVRRLVRERRIPFFRVESRYLFYRPVLEKWIQLRITFPIEGTRNQAEDIANAIWADQKEASIYGKTA